MFAIVISEKGGAERREVFEQAELSIGRVQGNELMLPKGNVSKRHARLVFRDGRFIVTDLNSTNGTYVNRRRINQATIVRQGDRIYVGDFVLRIEAGQGVESSIPAATTSASRPSAPPIPLRDPVASVPDTSGRSRVPPTPPAAPPMSAYPPVPPAPRLPASGSAPERAAGSSPAAGSRPEPSVVVERPSGVREDSIDTETTAYRSAVAALVERVAQRVDPRSLEREITEALSARVDRSIGELLEELRKEEVIGASIAEERLKRDAHAELLELGVLGPLLEDEGVTELAVVGTGAIVASRGGRRVFVEPPLSSEASVRRVLGRLARRSGTPIGADEQMISRRLPGGFRLSAISGERAPTGTLIRLERPQRVDSTLDDLVRSGAMSRAVATFLRHCVAVRANVLVVGPRDARPSAIAGALAAASPDGHVVALQSSDVVVSNAVTVSHLELGGAGEDVGRLVDFAGRLPDARLVVDDFSGATASAVMDAVSGGADGLIAVVTAPSLRRGLSRLPADLALSRPGLTASAARDWLAASFDVLIDVAWLRDGRQRVMRVAEPLAVEDGEIVARDVFSFVVERTTLGGTVEGTFQATGLTPKIVSDMSIRGIHVDGGVFSRPPSR